MFALAGAVSLGAGLAVTGWFGFRAWGGVANRIDTRSEAIAFSKDLGVALVGLAVVVTAIRVLAG